METLGRILVAIDFSEQAERAAALGLALAKACGARLYMLHVVYDLQTFPGVFVMQERLEDLQARLEAEAKERLEQFVHKRLQGYANTEICLATGAPAAQLLHTARTIQADLILLGAHVEGKPEYLLLGDTVARVVCQAPCPVTIVPPVRA
jgi:nucleotide-binding universal stress UspA family protein